MKKRRRLIFALSTPIILYFTYSLVFKDTTAANDIFIKAKEDNFLIEVKTSGELEAKNFIKVMGPTGLRSARIWQVKIDDIVAEGTVVDSGAFIAQLDASELNDKLSEASNELEQSNSKYIQTKMDTALTLREARDEMINLGYAVRQKQLIVEQSQYEPPATQRQNEIELEKAQREIYQAKENYLIKKAKAAAEMQESAAKRAEDQDKFDFMDRLRSKFTIVAPAPGMVIYHKDWDGQKVGAGGTVHTWNPVVATLPDLSKMISKTYINEIDIRNVREGQMVTIGLDAFPDKSLTGKVISVSNVGEQKPNTDAKVFEVSIEIHETDTTLRPSMTTSNNILIEKLEKVVYVPLECVHSQGDTISYVFRKDNLRSYKQQVVLGKSNENEVVIDQGLKAGDQLMISMPENPENYSLVMLEEDESSSLVSNE